LRSEAQTNREEAHMSRKNFTEPETEPESCKVRRGSGVGGIRGF
jgi:hypothetical protein